MRSHTRICERSWNYIELYRSIPYFQSPSLHIFTFIVHHHHLHCIRLVAERNFNSNASGLWGFHFHHILHIKIHLCNKPLRGQSSQERVSEWEREIERRKRIRRRHDKESEARGINTQSEIPHSNSLTNYCNGFWNESHAHTSRMSRLIC